MYEHNKNEYKRNNTIYNITLDVDNFTLTTFMGRNFKYKT